MLSFPDSHGTFSRSFPPSSLKLIFIPLSRLFVSATSPIHLLQPESDRKHQACIQKLQPVELQTSSSTAVERARQHEIIRKRKLHSESFIVSFPEIIKANPFMVRHHGTMVHAVQVGIG